MPAVILMNQNVNPSDIEGDIQVDALLESDNFDETLIAAWSGFK